MILNDITGYKLTNFFENIDHGHKLHNNSLMTYQHQNSAYGVTWY